MPFDYHITVVNDGSSDHTLAILEQAEKRVAPRRGFRIRRIWGWRLPCEPGLEP